MRVIAVRAIKIKFIRSHNSCVHRIPKYSLALTEPQVLTQIQNPKVVTQPLTLSLTQCQSEAGPKVQTTPALIQPSPRINSVLKQASPHTTHLKQPSPHINSVLKQASPHTTHPQTMQSTHNPILRQCSLHNPILRQCSPHTTHPSPLTTPSSDNAVLTTPYSDNAVLTQPHTQTMQSSHNPNLSPTSQCAQRTSVT
jgi:hypothetical protein